jgi:hypothetical protein
METLECTRLEGKEVLYKYIESSGKETAIDCVIAFMDRDFGLCLHCIDSKDCVLEFGYQNIGGKSASIIMSNDIPLIHTFRKKMTEYRRQAILGVITDFESDGINTVERSV